MRGSVPLLLMVATLLAGCSSSGGGMVRNGNVTDPTHVPSPVGTHIWMTYGTGVLSLSGGAGATAIVGIPERAQTMQVNLTLLEGPLVSPSATLANCSLDEDQTYAVPGQLLQFACDKPPAGNATLTLRHEGVTARVEYLVQGFVEHCAGQAGC